VYELAVHEISPHRYGKSHVVWDHTVTCHPTELTFPPLPPAEAGTRFSEPGGMQGWVDLYGGYIPR